MKKVADRQQKTIKKINPRYKNIGHPSVKRASMPDIISFITLIVSSISHVYFSSGEKYKPWVSMRLCVCPSRLMRECLTKPLQ